MKQNSTKNMILRHLKDIKAKIEQKTINNVKLSFGGTPLSITPRTKTKKPILGTPKSIKYMVWAIQKPSRPNPPKADFFLNPFF